MSQNDLSGKLASHNQPSSAQDSPASLIRVQENAKHLVMSVISGRNSGELFAKLNQDGSWAKMSQGSVQVRMDGSSEEYCETWPRWGIVLDGVAGRLRMSGHPTTESGSLLLPTCRSHEAGNYQYSKGDHGKLIPTLSGIVAMLPTVTTPRPHDNEKTAGEYIASQNQKDLSYALGKNHGLKLQPAFAEWMMGFPPEWTALSASEMPSCRSRSTRSSRQSRKSKTED